MNELKKSPYNTIVEGVVKVGKVVSMKRPEAGGPQWKDDKFHIFPTVPLFLPPTNR